MKFKVNPDILRHYPSFDMGLIVLHNLDINKRISVVTNLLGGVYAEKAREFAGHKIDDDPRIKVWRKTFRSFDFNPDKTRPSLEALLKKSIKGKAEPSHNPLIDIANYISLKYCVPVQCHDADQFSGNVELSSAEGGEAFKQMGSDTVEKVKKGEVTYKDEGGILCRAWNYKRCDRSKITKKTQNAVVFIDDMGVLGVENLKKAMQDFGHLVEKYCAAKVGIHVLENSGQEIDLGVEGLYGVSDAGIQGGDLFQKHTISKGEKAIKKIDGKLNMQNPAEFISKIIQRTLNEKFDEKLDEVKIDYPKEADHGDYSSNVAMILAKKREMNPRDLASQIIEQMTLPTWVEKAEIAGPGFINFHLSKDHFKNLINLVNELGEQYGQSKDHDGEKVMVEFAHPNTHKAFHVGHLRNICLGESIVRIFESQGMKVFRANYQGDVGPHVAKCLWGYMHTEVPKLKTVKEKAEFLGKVYGKGSKAYESDEEAKEEIMKINKQIYDGDEEIIPLWQETRKWSLDYFDYIYERLGTHFDRLFFESEVWEPGKKAVMEGLKKGIFEESEGAIVYDGEKHGLHKRVFITSQDTATYEAKEVGLAKLETTEFDVDRKVHVVANEQSGYFKVVFKAIEELMPKLKGKQQHVDYGLVKLPDGKMSSRTGDVIMAEVLLDEAKNKVKEYVEKTELREEEKREVEEQVAIGAIKFGMLHATASNDIVFDLDKATRLEGASGPYLQYAHARIASIIEKTESGEKLDYSLFDDVDWGLAKKLLHFPEIVSKAANEPSTHHITHYLVDLAGDFSSWYSKNSVSQSAELLKNARIKLIQAVAQVLKNGLYLLGIEAPNSM